MKDLDGLYAHISDMGWVVGARLAVGGFGRTTEGKPRTQAFDTPVFGRSGHRVWDRDTITKRR